ncbi:MAG: carboxymuconolactone decarboxylase family protein [Paracoccaceae bacterium]
MSFIKTVSEDAASGDTAALYDAARTDQGQIPNLTRAFSHRPEYMSAWTGLLDAIKHRMDPRRYELVTLAAALALRSSYCALAHGSVLLRDFFTAEELRAIVTDYRHSDLLPVDIAAMDYAHAIAADAAAITPSHLDALRIHGLTDAEITDIAAAAAARAFFGKFLDALGTHPDASYADLPAPVRDRLTVGRKIEK